MTTPSSSDTIRRVRAYFAVFGLTIVAAVACGARSGLPVPRPVDRDAGPDAVDAPEDAPPDVVDAPPDVPVVLNECLDAGITYIYLITEENELYSFYPPDIGSGTEFKDIGLINCPAAATNTPFSMGVDRTGTAYCVFQSGNLFQFSTGDPGGCVSTSYVPTQIGNGMTFGMGFAADLNDPGETLYVASDDLQGGPTTPEFLGTIDVKTFTLKTVGQFPKIIGSAELTGTGDGRLFGFGVDQAATGTTYQLLEFDTVNAGIKSALPIQMPTSNAAIKAWAFAFWGGDFYFFTSLDSMDHASIVSKYHPEPGDTVANATQILTAANTIVGAGVSTCAPQQ